MQYHRYQFGDRWFHVPELKKPMESVIYSTSDWAGLLNYRNEGSISLDYRRLLTVASRGGQWTGFEFYNAAQFCAWKQGLCDRQPASWIPAAVK